MNPDPTSLDLLHDVITPPAVPWWPPAPGWIWLFAGVIVAFGLAGICSFMRWQRDCYRREALAELRRYQPMLDDPRRRGQALASLAELLKRTALTAFRRAQVARLTGQGWFAFLNGAGGKFGFSASVGKVLESAAYHPEAAASLEKSDAREAAQAVKLWIAHHEVQSGKG